jgi:exodeoxyribonuclease VII small subunit
MATRSKAQAEGAGEVPDTVRDALRAEVAKLSYEEARDALVDVVRRLESGAETLEESLALWERGEHLAAVCQRWLDGARARLDGAREPAG